MSTMTALARAHAVATGQVQPTKTVRHVHVAERPFVCVPLALAGEANAPLAALVGDDRENPRLFVVHQPRDRDQRFAFAARFGRVFLGYIARYPSVTQTTARETTGPVDGPQLWVPNPASAAFLKLFARSTRYRSVDGPYPVEESVPRLGKWLTHFCDQAEIAGSSAFLASTSVLADHWATGQSAVEDAHLPALMAWLDPPDGMSARAAALAAEDPVLHPPAGPATDPSFDREVLQPGIEAYDAARTTAERRQAEARLESALRTQLASNWDLVWRSVELIRALPVGGHVAARWRRDVQEHQRFYAYLEADGRPQAKRDNAVRAAVRLNKLERTQAIYDAQRAFDDSLVMAEHRLAGEAFVGTVVSVESDRRVGEGRRAVLRPLITVHTEDPVLLREGVLTDQARRNQQAEIVAVEELPTGLHITLELSRGMGNGRTPNPGSVPAAGDTVCYSTLTDGYQRQGEFPSRDQTPWTHGGPPPAQAPATPDEQREDWS
jgi:hypothetical protein